jgi:hypothetical protein
VSVIELLLSVRQYSAGRKNGRKKGNEEGKIKQAYIKEGTLEGR